MVSLIRKGNTLHHDTIHKTYRCAGAGNGLIFKKRLQQSRAERAQILQIAVSQFRGSNLVFAAKDCSGQKEQNRGDRE